jgi:hypothetical protein
MPLWTRPKSSTNIGENAEPGRRPAPDNRDEFCERKIVSPVPPPPQSEVSLGVGGSCVTHEPIGNAYAETFILTTGDQVLFMQGNMFGVMPEEVARCPVDKLPGAIKEFLPPIIRDTIAGHFLRLSLQFRRQNYVCESYPVFAGVRSKSVVYALIRVHVPIPKATQDLIATISDNVRYAAHAERTIAERFGRTLAAPA